MSIGDRLLPVLGCISSTLKIKFSVVFKDSSFFNVLLIPRVLLGDLFCADLVVLCGTESCGDIRLSFLDLTNFELNRDRSKEGDNDMRCCLATSLIIS